MISCSPSCLTLCSPMDCSPPGSSVHGIFQARILKRVALCFSRGSSWLGSNPRLPHWQADSSEPPGSPSFLLSAEVYRLFQSFPTLTVLKCLSCFTDCLSAGLVWWFPPDLSHVECFLQENKKKIGNIVSSSAFHAEGIWWSFVPSLVMWSFIPDEASPDPSIVKHHFPLYYQW